MALGVQVPLASLIVKCFVNQVSKEFIMCRTLAEKRHNSVTKAIRKRNISEQIYHFSWYNNLHQYSKNKVHCSCPSCQTKTRNKGHRRYRKGGYYRAINYKRRDLIRMIDMDQDIAESLGIYSKRRVKEWI